MCSSDLFFYGQVPGLGLILVIYASSTIFALGGPQSVSMLKVSTGGELVGVAFSQIAFNSGNAIGAWMGGIPFAMGLSARFPLLVGAVLALLGLIFVGIYCYYYEAKVSAAPAAAPATPTSATAEAEATSATA